MDHSKLQDFIYFITHYQNINRYQQLKRDKLLLRDFYPLIHDRVLEHNTFETKQHRQGIYKDYIPPINLQNFLKEFYGDPILKYTCQLIDTTEVIVNICKECSIAKYDYFQHLVLIKMHFDDLKERFRKNHIILNSGTIALISTYLTGCSGEKDKREHRTWSSNDIIINWKSIQLIEWAKNNPGIIPNPGSNIANRQNDNGYVLPESFKSKTTGKRIKYFSDLVMFFNNQFYIGQDNTLRSILDAVNKKWNPQNVVFSYSNEMFDDNTELFTDVDKLIQAYKRVIEICIECHIEKGSPVNIELKFYHNPKEKQTYFTIHHTNSTYKKTVNKTLERIGEFQSKLIINQINGLCDLFIEAKFSDSKCGRVNLWDKYKNLTYTPCEGNIYGVKYIFIF